MHYLRKSLLSKYERTLCPVTAEEELIDYSFRPGEGWDGVINRFKYHQAIIKINTHIYIN
jgi:hypothetical protein